MLAVSPKRIANGMPNRHHAANSLKVQVIQWVVETLSSKFEISMAKRPPKYYANQEICLNYQHLGPIAIGRRGPRRGSVRPVALAA